MRTTIDIDDAVIKGIRELAAETGRTMASLIEDSLRETLVRRQVTNKRKREPKLTVVSGDGLLPGVDLDDSSALLDLMDERS